MLSVEVQDVVESEILVEDIKAWAEIAHKEVSNKEQDLVIRIVDMNEAKLLNSEYRNKDYATNVLSFVYDEPDFSELGIDAIEVTALENEHIESDIANNSQSKTDINEACTSIDYLGDIVICDEVISKEAKEQSKQYKDHFAHMVVHGILHLNGYDHEVEEEAEEMEKIEVKILARIGIQNPYT